MSTSSATDQPLFLDRYSAQDLDRTRALLWDTFGGDRNRTSAYLDWLYLHNPAGNALSANLDLEGRRVGHYCVVPVDYHAAGQRRRLSLSLNTAVDASVRKRGTFVRLAEETFRRAQAEYGVTGVVGVANENSTHGFVKRLGFRLLGQLPARVGLPVPLPGDAVETVAADATDVEQERRLAAVLERLDLSPGPGWSRAWTPETLRWRLRSPASRFALHVDSSGALISTRDRRMGVPFAVIVKAVPARGSTALAWRPLLAAACRHQRAPLYFYAGFNARLRAPGVRLPQRILPSPLNLIFRELERPEASSVTLVIDTFELLDFDLY